MKGGRMAPEASTGVWEGVDERSAWLIWAGGIVGRDPRDEDLTRTAFVVGVPESELRAWRREHGWDERRRSVQIEATELIRAQLTASAMRAVKALESVISDPDSNDNAKVRAALGLLDRVLPRSSAGSGPTVHVDRMLVASVRDLPMDELVRVSSMSLQGNIDNANMRRTTRDVVPVVRQVHTE